MTEAIDMTRAAVIVDRCIRACIRAYPSGKGLSVADGGSKDGNLTVNISIVDKLVATVDSVGSVVSVKWHDRKCEEAYGAWQ